MSSLRNSALLGLAAALHAAAATPATLAEPSADRWMYPSNSPPGSRGQASTFSALPETAGVEDRWGFFLVGFDTSALVPAGLPPQSYRIRSVVLRATIGQDGTFHYDPTEDPLASYATADRAASVADPDPGRPVELHGAGFRNDFTAATFTETSPYGFPERNAYPLGFDEAGGPRDVSWNVTGQFEARPWAVGRSDAVEPGAPVPAETAFTFDIDPSPPGVGDYLRQSLADGWLWLSLDSLHPAVQQGGELASWLTRDDAVHQIFGGLAPQLALEVELDIPLEMQGAPGSLTLAWPVSAGLTYELQATPDLAEPSWETVHVHEASTDGSGSHTDTATATRRFYRLQITPTP